jgi:hypothetical protein
MIARTYSEKNQCQGGAQNKMDNYIGPFWSDGKWQSSVEFGDAPPLSEVDAASRLHDSAYARFSDEKRRIAADVLYSEQLKKMTGAKSKLADVPLFGNFLRNRATQIGTDFVAGLKYGGLPGALGSLVYSGVKGMVQNHDLAVNLPKYKKEVEAYYATDPKKQSYDVEEAAVSPQRPVVHKPVQEAPKTKQKEEETEMFKKKTIAPAPSAPVATQRSKPATPAANPVSRPYKPIRKKKNRVGPDEAMLYLKYHPGEAARVLAWLEETYPK